MLKVLTQAVEGRVQSPAHLPPAMLASQIAAAQFALLEPWIAGQSTLTPDTLAESLCRTSRALAKPADPINCPFIGPARALTGRRFRPLLLAKR
ncbi:MAG: hypothetical protein WDN06_20860 [Asticcacaulis sp.]